MLSRFLASRDETAFTALVERHGRMVREVCQRLLHHEQDVEDASQRVFLLLMRKAVSIRKRDSLRSWLHGAAYRVAGDVRKNKSRRQVHEISGDDCGLSKPAKSVEEAELHELQTLVETELRGLPEKYRLPFVLCCREGKSKKKVAQELGWPEGTVASRVAKARQLLQRGLARYGITGPNS